MNPSLEHTIAEIAQSFGWAIGQIHREAPTRDLYCRPWEDGQLRTQEIINCANLLVAWGVDWETTDWLLATEKLGIMLAEGFHGLRSLQFHGPLITEALDTSGNLH